MSSFFTNGSVGSQLYKYLRDSPEEKVCDARAFTNMLWSCASDYVNLDLQTNAQKQFHHCFWEMYLVATLLEKGFLVTRREDKKYRQKGPDVQVGNPVIWFEAVAVTAGTGPDAVQEFDPESRVAIDVPQDKIKLRLTAGIQEKFRKYKRYRQEDIVKDSEPFIIAINAALVPHVQLIELTVPWIVKSLFPIGHEVLQFNLNTREVIDQFHASQEFMVKEEGREIPTDFFEQPGSEGISAVLYSTAHVFAYRELGSDFKLVHNPNAKVPIPRKFLPCGSEYWMEGDQLFYEQYAE